MGETRPYHAYGVRMRVNLKINMIPSERTNKQGNEQIYKPTPPWSTIALTYTAEKESPMWGGAYYILPPHRGNRYLLAVY